MRRIPGIVTAFIFLLTFTSLLAQKETKEVGNKCGSAIFLQQRFLKNPALKAKFAEQEASLQKIIKSRVSSFANRGETAVSIPIVFHVVLPDPTVITDAEIQAQMDTINRDYAGINGDSVRIPSYFKPLFGKSTLQFCLAQRTPTGENTTGIVRQTTTITSFGVDGTVKHASSGGADAWDPDSYLNVWVCIMSNGVLGFGTFPNGSEADEQGVVIDYGSVPGGVDTRYNKGKTLTHEIGHYFNLYHTWGDDDGACTGTDYVDDTPNQTNYTSSCPSGVVTDACTPTSPGVLYQDYMDYSDDDCLVTFTNDQVARMEAALTTYRSTLLSSKGCQPVALQQLDAQLVSINAPGQRLCVNSFTPAVTIKNYGLQTITSLNIYTKVDNVVVSTFNWTGSLASLTSTNVTLPNLTTVQGNHTLTVYTAAPNKGTDLNTSNDTLKTSFQYYEPVATNITESFEGATFPPAGWDIVNPDKYYTWQKITGAAVTGNSSVSVQNYFYNGPGQKDYLRLPEVTTTGLDSLFISFQVAAATYTDPSTANNTWDTLQVMISTDCGNTYTSVYKNWGSTLVTRKGATTTSFVPTSAEWRKDSVDISSFIADGQIMIAMVNTNNYENNIYLDDINVRRVTVNPNLKAQGFLVTPNPTRNTITVQFYPQPANLQGIEIFNMLGQKLAETITGGTANNYYTYDLSKYAAGMYFVRAVYSDKVLVKKIIKQ